MSAVEGHPDGDQGQAGEACENCPAGRPADYIVRGSCPFGGVAHEGGMCDTCWQEMGWPDRRLSCPCGAMHLRDDILRIDRMLAEVSS